MPCSIPLHQVVQKKVESERLQLKDHELEAESHPSEVSVQGM